MGCDIHMFAERRNDKKNKWIKIDKEFKNPYYEEYKNNGEEPPRWCEQFTDKVYDGRDYELFAFLADVRNYNNIKFVSEPKGVPEDASHGYLHILDNWGYDPDDEYGDSHSHSYFTLKELKEIPKEILEQELYNSDFVLNRDEKGNITSTARWFNGYTEDSERVGNVKIFHTFGDNSNTITPIQEIINKLEDYKETGEYYDCVETDEDVRIVFFFDN